LSGWQARNISKQQVHQQHEEAMFSAIRKFLKRLAWTAGILLLAGVILVALAAPDLILNIGKIGLLFGAALLILHSLAGSFERGYGIEPSDKELRRRYRKKWF
jgi:hypothetical protein